MSDQRFVVDIPPKLADALAEAIAPPTKKKAKLAELAETVTRLATIGGPIITVLLFAKFGCDQQRLQTEEQAQRVANGRLELKAAEGHLNVQTRFVAIPMSDASAVPSVTPPDLGGSTPDVSGSSAPARVPTMQVSVSTNHARLNFVIFDVTMTNPNKAAVDVCKHTLYVYTAKPPTLDDGKLLAEFNQPGTEGRIAWNELSKTDYSEGYGNTGLHKNQQTSKHRYSYIISVEEDTLLAVRSVLELSRNGSETTQEMYSWCVTTGSSTLADALPCHGDGDEHGATSQGLWQEQETQTEETRSR